MLHMKTLKCLDEQHIQKVNVFKYQVKNIQEDNSNVIEIKIKMYIYLQNYLQTGDVLK